MLTVLWDAAGYILVDLMFKKAGMNSNVYIDAKIYKVWPALDTFKVLL